MPVHEPAPTKPTDKCPKCGETGVVEQVLGPMKAYACPRCKTKWIAPA